MASEPLVSTAHLRTIVGEPRQLSGIVGLVVSALLAWGVLAFGAVYQWGAIPLLLVAAALGGAVCVRAGSGHPRVPLAAATLMFAVLLQLISMPKWLLAFISPGANEVLRAQRLDYRLLASWHALSIDPGRTFEAAATIGALILFGLGVRTALESRGGERLLISISGHLVVLGTFVAVIGLLQAATSNGKLYWLWTPYGSSAGLFGPFVNHNHFAGWMLLALFSGGGYLGTAVADLPRKRLKGARRKLLWLSSPEWSRVICTAAALFTMSVSLVWTLSRSGIMALLVAATVFLIGAVRRRRPRAGAVTWAIGVICVASLLWKGTEPLATWYSRTETFEWRVALWRDSLPALKDFWMLGSGLNTFELVMLSYPRSDPSLNPVNAHNDYLQVAIEGGLLIAVPLILLAVAAIGDLRTRFAEPQSEQTYWLRLGATAAIAGIAVQEFAEFSLHVPGIAIFFVTALAMAVHRSPDFRSRYERCALPALVAARGDR